MKRLLPLLLLLPWLASCVALAAAGAGAAATYGYVSWRQNEETRDFQKPIEAVWKASLHSLEAQEYAIRQGPKLTRTEGTIEAESADVKLERLASGSTRVRVSVGTFDSAENRRLARLLLDEIGRRLGR